MTRLFTPEATASRWRKRPRGSRATRFPSRKRCTQLGESVLEIEIPRCVCRQVESSLNAQRSDASSVTFGGFVFKMGEDGKRVMGWG